MKRHAGWNRTTRSAVGLLTVALSSGAALGVDWVGPIGSFNDPTQWSTGVVPGTHDTVSFPNGGVVTVDADAAVGALNFNSANQSTALFLGLTPFASPPAGTAHALDLKSSIPAALAFDSGSNVLIAGGNITAGASGLMLGNANVTFSSYANINVLAHANIVNGSILTIGNSGDAGTSSFSAGVILVGNSGTGTLAIGSKAIVKTSELTIGTNAGGTGHVTIQSGNVTADNVYVGGSSAGAGGTGALDVGFGSTASLGLLRTNHLVVYAGSTVTTNQCGNIFTSVSDISGNLLIESTHGTGGGLNADNAINLLPGSHTSLAAGSTSLTSPMVTLSAGAIFSGSGRIGGNLVNGGEVDAAGLSVSFFGNVGPFNTTSGSYTQLSSGTLAGTAGSALINATGTASVDGTLRLIFDAPANVHSGDSFPVISATSITGAFDTIDLVGLTGFTASFSDLTGRVTVIGGSLGPVPEPTCAALLSLATLGLMLRLRPR